MQTLGGVGVVHSPEAMYQDMHSYLQGTAARPAPALAKLLERWQQHLAAQRI